MKLQADLKSRPILASVLCAAFLTVPVHAGKTPADVAVVGFERSVLYRSPETSGYTCWVSLWTMPDGALMLSFNQATGPKEGRPRAGKKVLDWLGWPPAGRPDYDMTGTTQTILVVESRDDGMTWTPVSRARFESPMNGPGNGGHLALEDGTILRTLWGHYWPYRGDPQTGFIQRSADRTDTWGKPELFTDLRTHLAYPTRLNRLRDGRITLFAGVARKKTPFEHRTDVRGIRKLLYLSKDGGKTWSDPIDTAPGPATENMCEESVFIELPNGDLFFLHRAENRTRDGRPVPGYSDRRQNVLRRKGETFIAGPVRVSKVPHGGFPCLLLTPEGVILNIASEAVYWTASPDDEWKKLDCPGTGYYPQATQLADGTILVVYHQGGDDAYGHVVQHIGKCTFKIKVRN